MASTAPKTQKTNKYNKNTMTKGVHIQPKKHVTALRVLSLFVMIAVACGVALALQKHVLVAYALQKPSQVFLPPLKAEIAPEPLVPVRKEDTADLYVTNAHAAAIVDINSGTLLYAQNALEPRAIASLTKVVTAMLVVDQVRDLDMPVTLTREGLAVEGTRVGCPSSFACTGTRLYPGEQVSVRNLLRAMVMNSANDAATSLAIHVAGSETAFADLMNTRLQELEIINSNFCRPSGLELDENEDVCYATAYDIARVMALILRDDKYAVLHDMFLTKETIIHSTDGRTAHELGNTNELLGNFPGLLAAKTGFTYRAGYSLVFAAEDPHDADKRVVAVVLDDPYRFDDTAAMVRWAFQSFVWQ